MIKRKTTLFSVVQITLLALLFSCAEPNFFKGERIEVPIVSTTKIIGELIDNKSMVLKVNVTDKYLFLTMYDRDYFLQIVDKKTMATIGQFCLLGNGPNEFTSFDILNQQMSDDVILLCDYNENTVYQMDVERSIEENKTIISNQYALPIRDKMIFSVFLSQSMDFILKEYDQTVGEFAYYDKQNDNRVALYNNKLSKNDINAVLTLADGYNSAANQIVSVTGSNQLDIINLSDPSKNLSLVVEGQPNWEFSHYEMGDQRAYYQSVPRFNSHHIVALFSNNSRTEFHITNWSGDFVRVIEVDQPIRDFNVDWDENVIYGLDLDDNLWKFHYEI